MDKMDEVELLRRKLRYRLSRLGMLELEAWLAPLLDADWDDPEIAVSLRMLLDYEVPELQRMMHGELALPGPLQRWLRHG